LLPSFLFSVIRDAAREIASRRQSVHTHRVIGARSMIAPAR
jgi:hypothetical protein